MKLREGEIKVGAVGRATEILSELEPSDRPDLQGSVGIWFLDCPGQSPAWRHYLLSIAHLRPIEGVKPARIFREGATHEVMLLALDPEANPAPCDEGSWKWLSPTNYAGQIILPSDRDARRVIGILARATADGLLWAEPPLSGQKEPWESQLRQLEDHAAGRHSK